MRLSTMQHTLGGCDEVINTVTDIEWGVTNTFDLQGSNVGVVKYTHE